MHFEIKCRVCGEAVKAEWYYPRSWSDPQIKVLPCAGCLDEQAAKSVKEGYKEGYEEGFADGLKSPKEW
jgi:hypothetical protein